VGLNRAGTGIDDDFAFGPQLVADPPQPDLPDPQHTRGVRGPMRMPAQQVPQPRHHAWFMRTTTTVARLVIFTVHVAAVGPPALPCGWVMPDSMHEHAHRSTSTTTSRTRLHKRRNPESAP